MSGKKAKNPEVAWDIQERFEDQQAGAWIQWKATEVFMDVTCKCGAAGNVKGSFAYHVKCPKCGRVYFMNGHIEMIEIEEEPGNVIEIW